MTDTSTFTLALDNRISGPAGEARTSLRSLREEMSGNRGQLSTLQAQMRASASGLSRLHGAARTSAGSLGGVGDAGAAGGAGVAGLGRSALSTLGNLGSMAHGALAVVGAVRSMVSSVIDGATALGRFALASAEATRAEELRLEVFARVHGRTRDAAGTAREMSDAIDSVADRTGASREQLEGYARAAYRAGLRGEALEAALRGASTKGAALGERWGRSFVYAAAAAGRAGQDIGQLADDTERRYGRLAERQLSSTEGLWRRFKGNISSLFRDINVEPLLESLSRFVNLFSRSNEVGKTFAETFTRVGNDGAMSLARFVDAMGTLVERGTLGLVTMEGEWLEWQLGVALATRDVRKSIDWVIEKFDSLRENMPDWLSGLGGTTDLERRMRQQGLDVALGLAKGILDGAGPAARAASEVMGEAERAARERAQIRSPSRLFAELGRQLGAGVEVGIDREAPRVRSAAAELVEPPLLPPPRARSAESGGESSTRGRDSQAESAPAPRVSIVVGDVVVQTTSGETMLDDLRARVEEIFLDAARSAGVA